MKLQIYIICFLLLFFFSKETCILIQCLALSSKLQMIATKGLGFLPAYMHMHIFTSMHIHAYQRYQALFIYFFTSHAFTESMCIVVTQQWSHPPILCCAGPVCLRGASRMHSQWERENFYRTTVPPPQGKSLQSSLLHGWLWSVYQGLPYHTRNTSVWQNCQNVRGHESHTACHAFS